MCHVIACVSKNASAVSSQGRVPVPRNYGVCEFPKGRGQHHEERRGHDKPVLVHGEVVMDAVEEEVEGEGNAVIREVAV